MAITKNPKNPDSKLFKRSSVEIFDVINYDHINKQYYFKMRNKQIEIEVLKNQCK